MTKEEIIAKLAGLLGEEQAAAAANALIGAEEGTAEGAEGEPGAPEDASQTPETVETAETEQCEGGQTAPEDEPGEEKAAAPEAAADESDTADSDETESASGENAPSESAPDETFPDAALLRERLKRMTLKIAALSLGVSPERVNVVCRLADMGEVDPASEEAAQQAENAVRRVLEEVPELAGGMPATGAIGTHARQSMRVDDPFTKGFFR